jgi:hypothetical protein
METGVHELTPHIGDTMVNGVPTYWLTCSCGGFSTHHKRYDRDWLDDWDHHWIAGRRHWVEATGAAPFFRRRRVRLTRLRLFDPDHYQTRSGRP